MEYIAVNNLANISQQTFYQQGWLTPLHHQQVPPKNNKQFSRKIQSLCHAKNKQLKKQVIGNLMEVNQIIHKKLLTFHKPLKQRTPAKKQIIVNRSKFPSLPIKLSPNKQLKLLIKNHQLDNSKSNIDVCKTINLWDNASKKIRNRQYTEIIRTMQSEKRREMQSFITKGNNFNNTTIANLLHPVEVRNLQTVYVDRFEPKQCKTVEILYSKTKKNKNNCSNNITTSQLSHISSGQELLIQKAQIKPKKKPCFVKKFITGNSRKDHKKSHSLFLI